MTKHYLKLVLATAMLVLIGQTQSFAGRGDKTKSIHTPVGGSTVDVGTATAIDSIQLDPLGTLQQDYNVRNRISFGVDLHYPQFVPGPQVVKVSIHVKQWDVTGAALPDMDFSLKIVYFHSDTVHSMVLDKKEFSDAYKMVFRIDTIWVDGTLSSTLPVNLFVQGDIFVERYTQLSSASVAREVFFSDVNCDDKNDAIIFRWDPVTGAEEYQVEFVHISNYGANNTTIPPANLTYDFRHNSTRITTSTFSYEIPLIFDRGWIAYRVRPVGVDINAPEHPIYGQWSVVSPTGNIASLGVKDKLEITGADIHRKTINWQYSANYAEQGKRKDIISYYDGTLRSRQNVTKLNSENNTLVGETIYDFQGRPAINVLPVPVELPECNRAGTAIDYYENFNRNDDDKPYSKTDFDLSAEGSCNLAAESMNTKSGAAKYYSDENPDQELQQAYLPKSYGYPFQQIEYTPDVTGRISRQGTVGPEFQLGSGKETKFLYGNPNQLELNRLFGTEVGYSEHYQKNAVIDANGQVSISYVDMSGRVIATAMAGDSPKNLKQIGNVSGEALEINYILPDGSNQVFDDLSNTITFSSSFIVTAPTEAKIDYQAETFPLTDSCLTDICIDCVYDLEITLKDDCGSDLLSEEQMHDMVGNFSGEPGNYVFHQYCQDVTQFQTTATVFLPIGKYTISKTLTIREDAVKAYLDLADSSECALTYQDFLDAEMQLVDSSVCMINCENCLEELGTLQDFISNGQGTAEDYYLRVEECQSLCEDRVNDCKMYLTVMQIDMSPGGQYAEYLNPSSGSLAYDAPLSIFNTSNYLPNALASWRNPVLVLPNGNQNWYVDASGERSRIYLTEDPANPGTYLPAPLNPTMVQYDAALEQYYIYPEQLASALDFIDRFIPSWAKSLVKYHPEYCYYESCVQYEEKHAQTDAFSSSSFDDMLYNTTTFAEAQALGFVTAGGLPSNWGIPSNLDPTDSLKPWDPFIFYDSDFQTAQCSGYGDKLYNRVLHYKYEFGQWFSMAEIAAYTARCGSNFPSVPPVDCYNFGQLYNGIVDTVVLNDEWNILKALYMSAKQGFQQELAECTAIKDCDSYNGCIGNTSYSPFPKLRPVHLTSSSWYHPFLDMGQPCSAFNFRLYRNKIKRFSDHEDAMAENANSTAYELYLQTGQCPSAFALQNLLNELAHETKLTAASFNLSSTSYLPALLQADNNMYNPGTSPALTYTATVATNTITANWNDGSTTLATLTLTKTAPQSWNDVIGITNLYATGEHSFTAEAIYTDLGTSTNEVFPISGELSYFNLNGCAFEQECKSSQLALDLTTVLNVLVLDGSPENVSPVDLAPYTSTTLGSTVDLASLYINNAANSGTDLSIVSSGSTWRIFDASSSGNNGLHIKITDTSGTLSSAIIGYEPMVSTGNYSFEIVAQQSVGYPVTFSGVMYQIHGSDTIGISAGECGLPVPNKCQGQAFEVFEDLQPLLTDELIHYDGVADINLYSSILTTPAIVSALSFEDSQTTSNDLGDSLIISSSACDLVLTMDTSHYVQFDNIIGLSNWELTGETNDESAFNHFKVVATFQGPSGTIQDTIYGSTCFSLRDCYPCSDSAVVSSGVSALRQVATAVESTEDFKNLTGYPEDVPPPPTFVAPIYDTTGCWSSYGTYLNCITNFNESYSYYQIEPIAFATFKLNQYCHCIDAYCELLEEVVSNELEFPDQASFLQFVAVSNACTYCPQYSNYVSAVGYYNTHTTTFQLLDTIPVNLFNAYGYCNCLEEYQAVLTGIITTGMQFANQEHFDNYASMARICSDDSINEPEDPCILAYVDYLECSYRLISENPTAFTLSVLSDHEFDSLGLCTCTDAYCSAIDAILAGIVTFESQTDFDNYVFSKLSCNPYPPCTPAPSTGIPPSMPVVELENDCIAAQVNLATINAQNAYNMYLDSIHTVKRQKYLDHCMQTQEKLYNSYNDRQHHYMLYYYDQAGNLIKTVPPEGVQLLPITSTSDPLNVTINNDRDNGTKTVFTSHRLQTRYEYNSLNQLIAQYSPDIDAMSAFEQTLPNGLSSRLVTRKIQMLNDAIGYLAGEVDQRGYLYKTADGGKTWNRIDNLIGADLKKMVMFNSTVGIAVGQSGTVLKTSDGGQSWDLVITWVTSGMINTINDVLVLNPTTSPEVIVVGENGFAARCTNFTSSSPTFSLINTGLSGDVRSVEVISGNLISTAYDQVNGISRFYKYASSVWSELTDVRTNNFSDVHFYATDKAYAADFDGRIFANNALSSGTSTWVHRSSDLKDSITSIRFFDQQQGVSLVQKDGVKKIYRTTDEAASWNRIDDSTFNALAISTDRSVAAVAGNDKRIGIIFPYTSGIDQLVDVTPPGAAGNLLAVWIDKSTSGAVQLIVADNQRIFSTEDALTASPVWHSYTYSGVGSPITKMEAELTSTGKIYGVAITQSGQAWRLKRDGTPEVQLVGSNIGAGYSAVTKGDFYFYLSQTSGTGLHRVNKDATFTATSTGTLSFSSPHISALGQKLVVADYTGQIGYVTMHTTGATLTSSISHTNKVYPDRINRLKTDVSAGKLWAFGDDGLAYHWDEPASSFKRLSNPVNGDILDAHVSGTGIYLAGSNGLAKKGTHSAYSSLELGDIMLSSGQSIAGSLPNTDLHGIALTTGNRLYLAGSNGTLLYSPNIASINPSLISQSGPDLYGIAVLTGSDNVMVCGASGRIQVQYGAMSLVNRNIFITPIKSVHFRDAANGTLIADNFISRTTSNASGSWKIVKPEGAQNPLATYNKVWTLSGGRSLLFGNGHTLMHNANTGITAAVFSSTDIKAIAAGTDAQNIFIVDGNSVKKVDLASLTAATLHTMSGSNPVKAIQVFKNGDHIVVGDGGLYKHFDVSGTAFSYATGLPSANFTDLAFFDRLNGIIVGVGGVYYRSSNQSVSVDGFMESAQWDVRNLNSNDPLGVTNADINSLSLASATNILIGGKNPSMFATEQFPYVRHIYDAGGRYTNRFYYDRLGRLVVSRNSHQEVDNRFSYLLYDELGRVIESGEKAENSNVGTPRFRDIFGTMVAGNYSPVTMDDQKLGDWITGDGGRTEVTHSYYDDVAISGLPASLSSDATTKRLRIVHATFEEAFDGDDQTFDHATHYAYDIHGNVKTLVQDNQKMAVTFPSLDTNRFREMAYAYDLITGNVNRMSLFSSMDHWSHAYVYDADNRLRRVYTNTSRPLTDINRLPQNMENELVSNSDWQQDAQYYFYRHGPLARVELGQNNLQGLDYYYKLQGWIKGVNTTTLGYKDDSEQVVDPGADSDPAKVNALFAKDVFGFGLDYYKSDYDAISSKTPYATVNEYSDAGTNSFDLYNGNIRYMQTAITNPVGRSLMPMLNAYRYDQLNRLSESRSYFEGNLDGVQWNPGGYSNEYYNKFEYDAVGNILSQQRHKSDGTQLEDLSYKYQRDDDGNLVRNRLYHVIDNVSGGVDTSDIDDMGAFDANHQTINQNNNYQYDHLGRLVKDSIEEIDTIFWTAQNKVKEIRRIAGSDRKNLVFDYDALGHRIAKHVYSNETWMLERSTYYILDAQGRQLSVYEHKPAVAKSSSGYFLTERNIYGIERMGTVTDTVSMAFAMELPSYGWLGNRNYELKNHLGNVLTTISDIVYPESSNGTNVDHYLVGINKVTDYSPFGVELDGRTITAGISSGSHRFGFQGQEKDNEIKGEGNSLNYEFRMHDPRLGRFFAIDPLTEKYPELTPYQFSSNRLVDCIELEGLEAIESKYDSPYSQYFIGGSQTKTDKQIKAYMRPQRGTVGVTIGMGLGLGGKALLLYLGEEVLEELAGFPIVPDPGDGLQSMMKKSVKSSTSNPLKVLPSDDLITRKTKREAFAKKYYKKVGGDASQTNGIDFSQPVFENTFKKGTVLEQWSYLDENGVPKRGNYYTLPGADPNKLGIPLEGRVKTKVTLNERTTFLQSTTSDVDDWTVQGRKLKGGETQLYRTNVNVTQEIPE